MRSHQVAKAAREFRRDNRYKPTVLEKRLIDAIEQKQKRRHVIRSHEQRANDFSAIAGSMLVVTMFSFGTLLFYSWHRTMAMTQQEGVW